MNLELRRELHEDLLRADRVAQLLDDLLDFVVELWLRADDMEPVDQLRHHLARVVAILRGHHADEEHDAFDETRILEVQIDDQALEHILMLLYQILAELLE